MHGGSRIRARFMWMYVWAITCASVSSFVNREREGPPLVVPHSPTTGSPFYSLSLSLSFTPSLSLSYSLSLSVLSTICLLSLGSGDISIFYLCFFYLFITPSILFLSISYLLSWPLLSSPLYSCSPLSFSHQYVCHRIQLCVYIQQMIGIDCLGERVCVALWCS